MAVMWPRKIPREVEQNPLRSAELKVFNAFAKLLEEEYTVYYSRPWLGLTPSGGERDGECDFLIAHREYGILALEVKGGEISFDPHTDTWKSKDRYGFVHTIKDPISQARTAKHNLLKKFHAVRNMQARRIGASHGVVLTDCDSPPRDLRADAPREIFCCARDLKEINKWVRRRMKPAADVEKLGADGGAAFDSFLASPFTLKVPLGRWLEEDEAAIAALTPQQFRILEAAQDIPRACISGGAGTGKTILALEDARRYSSQGFRTLLTCYNAPLAEELSRRMHPAGPKVQTGTFHQICMRVCQAAGVPLGQDRSPHFFNEVLPECFARAFDRKPELRWDAIIVDEAQDFDFVWWLALDAALERRNGSRLHVFLDSNQRVYQRGSKLPAEFQLVPIRLNYNLRNTRSIHDAAMRHYDGIEILANDIQGQKVEAYQLSAGEDFTSWLQGVLRRLVNKDGVPPGSIAVLFSGASQFERPLHDGMIAGHRVVRAEQLDEDAIVIDTIARFKGLERSTIILLATSDILSQTEAAYVAATRARVHLIVAGDPATVHWILQTT
jgi:hypothetical protein